MSTGRLTFFSQQSAAVAQPKKWINAGTIYRAMAVAYSESVLWGMRAHPSVEKILHAYSKQYPHIPILGKINTPSSQFKHLFDDVPGHGFLNQLASTLFKLVLQSGLQQSTAYAPKLLLSPKQFHHSYFVEKNALPILADQLGMQIHFHDSSLQKSLPKNQLFTPSGSAATIHAKLWKRDKQYFTFVRDSTLYQTGLTRSEEEYKDNQTTELFITHLKKLSTNIEEKYRDICHRLIAWHEAGEISDSVLKSFYMEFATQPQYQLNRFCEPDPKHDIISALAELAACYSEIKTVLFSHMDNQPTLHSSSFAMG